MAEDNQGSGPDGGILSSITSSLSNVVSGISGWLSGPSTPSTTTAASDSDGSSGATSGAAAGLSTSAPAPQVNFVQGLLNKASDFWDNTFIPGYQNLVSNNSNLITGGVGLGIGVASSSGLAAAGATTGTLIAGPVGGAIGSFIGGWLIPGAITAAGLFADKIVGDELVDTILSNPAKAAGLLLGKGKELQQEGQTQYISRELMLEIFGVDKEEFANNPDMEISAFGTNIRLSALLEGFEDRSDAFFGKLNVNFANMSKADQDSYIADMRNKVSPFIDQVLNTARDLSQYQNYMQNGFPEGVDRNQTAESIVHNFFRDNYQLAMLSTGLGIDMFSGGQRELVISSTPLELIEETPALKELYKTNPQQALAAARAARSYFLLEEMDFQYQNKQTPGAFDRLQTSYPTLVTKLLAGDIEGAEAMLDELTKATQQKMGLMFELKSIAFNFLFDLFESLAGAIPFLGPLVERARAYGKETFGADFGEGGTLSGLFGGGATPPAFDGKVSVASLVDGEKINDLPIELRGATLGDLVTMANDPHSEHVAEIRDFLQANQDIPEIKAAWDALNAGRTENAALTDGNSANAQLTKNTTVDELVLITTGTKPSFNTYGITLERLNDMMSSMSLEALTARLPQAAELIKNIQNSITPEKLAELQAIAPQVAGFVSEHTQAAGTAITNTAASINNTIAANFVSEADKITNPDGNPVDAVLARGQQEGISASPSA